MRERGRERERERERGGGGGGRRRGRSCSYLSHHSNGVLTSGHLLWVPWSGIEWSTVDSGGRGEGVTI